jgi:hypothetical protein
MAARAGSTIAPPTDSIDEPTAEVIEASKARMAAVAASALRMGNGTTGTVSTSGDGGARRRLATSVADDRLPPA